MRRLAVVTCALIGHPSQHVIGLLYRAARWLMPPSQRALPADRREQERIVCTSDLDWTLVRPPRLSNDRTGPHPVRAATGLKIDSFTHVGRADLARFVIDGRTFVHEGVAVAYGRPARSACHGGPRGRIGSATAIGSPPAPRASGHPGPPAFSMPLALPFLFALLVPVQDPLRDLRRVRIENPDRCTLALYRVLDDASDLVARLGVAAEIERELPGDRCYWIEVAHDGRTLRVPLPLPRRAATADPLVVRVHAPPAEHADWAFVPSGPALQGDVLGVGQEDERPARVVDVPAFWLGRREVTNREYAAFLAAVDAAIEPGWIDLSSRKCQIRRESGSARWTTDAPDLPVVTVSWFGADAYCAWRTRATGTLHRLPTEVEWEKAARGPETFTYAYGNIYAVARANQESGALAPVGATGGPNGFGLSDMTGNAFEWVADPYSRNAYAGAAPPDDGTPIGYRVLRGGSFVLDGMYLRNSFRMKLRPSVRTDDIGFRVLREEAPDSEEKR